jgi:hypothetical protein
MVKALRDFQLSFAKHVRDPHNEPLLPGISPRRAQIYEELLSNNISGFVDSCFPVCKDIIGPSPWRQLCKQFLCDWRCHTPYFSDIPGEFLRYLQQCEVAKSLPPWLLELAHYEWVELRLETMEENRLWETRDKEPDSIYVRTPVKNLVYNWPVHDICKDYQPDSSKKTFLVVLRSKDFKMKFVEISSATSLLINLVQETPKSRHVIAEQMSQLLAREGDSNFLSYCNQIIDDLVHKDVFSESSV